MLFKRKYYLGNCPSQCILDNKGINITVKNVHCNGNSLHPKNGYNVSLMFK
jgi:hypothetical protein